ncbi:hypothetical protein AAMO2058_000294400 [Amorphochlora amoebiformis]
MPRRARGEKMMPRKKFPTIASPCRNVGGIYAGVRRSRSVDMGCQQAHVSQTRGSSSSKGFDFSTYDSKASSDTKLPVIESNRTKATNIKKDLSEVNDRFYENLSPKSVLQRVRRSLTNPGNRRTLRRHKSASPRSMGQQSNGVYEWFRNHGKRFPPLVDKDTEMEMREVFSMIDEDGSQTIDFHELKVALANIGIHVSVVALKRHLASVDKAFENAKGFDFNMFLTAFDKKAEWDALLKSEQTAPRSRGRSHVRRSSSLVSSFEGKSHKNNKHKEKNDIMANIPFHLWVPAYWRKKQMEGVMNQGSQYLEERQAIQRRWNNTHEPWDNPSERHHTDVILRDAPEDAQDPGRNLRNRSPKAMKIHFSRRVPSLIKEDSQELPKKRLQRELSNLTKSLTAIRKPLALNPAGAVFAAGRPTEIMSKTCDNFGASSMNLHTLLEDCSGLDVFEAAERLDRERLRFRERNKRQERSDSIASSPATVATQLQVSHTFKARLVRELLKKERRQKHATPDLEKKWFATRVQLQQQKMQKKESIGSQSSGHSIRSAPQPNLSEIGIY